MEMCDRKFNKTVEKESGRRKQVSKVVRENKRKITEKTYNEKIEGENVKRESRG